VIQSIQPGEVNNLAHARGGLLDVRAANPPFILRFGEQSLGEVEALLSLCQGLLQILDTSFKVLESRRDVLRR
jgi:hypothetical protein